MGGSRITPVTAALCLAVLAVASHAGATVGRVTSPSAGGVFVSGSMAEVRWEGLEPDSEEFELLLSVDCEQTTRIRLTPELDATLGRYVWLVPNLPTTDARLRLRVGRRGVEVEARPSEPFTIVGRPEIAATALHFSGGEWWARPAALPDAEAPERNECAVVSLDVSLASPESATLDASGEPLVPAVRTLQLPPRTSNAPSTVALSPALPRSPALIPQRE